MDNKSSPYLSYERYNNPKEDFKSIAGVLRKIFSAESEMEVADIGCANGELLYYLHTLFPNWILTGYDRNKEFLDTGRSYPGLDSVRFEQKEFQEIRGNYDIVLATCFLPFFQDIEEPIKKLLSLCRKGGYLLATGLFNPYDIDVRVQYFDHSDVSAKWVNDFNRHSMQRIKNLLATNVESIEFIKCNYNVDIARNSEQHARVWSFKDEHGDRILINGAWQIANQTLMIVRK